MTHIHAGDTLYTPIQLAQHLQVTRRTVYVWIKKKKLAAVRAGGRVRIHAEAVDAFLSTK